MFFYLLPTISLFFVCKIQFFVTSMSDQDPDPHWFGSTDPDPYWFGSTDPDPH